MVEFILNKDCLSKFERKNFENISIEMQLYKQLGEKPICLMPYHTHAISNEITDNYIALSTKKLPIIPKNQEQSFLFARFIHLMVKDKRHLIYEDCLPFYEVVYRWGHHDA